MREKGFGGLGVVEPAVADCTPRRAKDDPAAVPGVAAAVSEFGRFVNNL